MPGIKYSRFALRLRIAANDEGVLTVQSGQIKALRKPLLLRDFSVRDLNSWMRSPRFLAVARDPGLHSEGSSRQPVPLIALEPAEFRLQERNLESMLEDAREQLGRMLGVEWPIVRISRVRPRALNLDFTLPLRVLQIEPADEWKTASSLQSLFSRHEKERDDVVRLNECTLGELQRFRRDSKWPTAEVLHFGRWGDLAMMEEAFSTSQSETTGTVGWLSRLTDTWQTRLVILHCRDKREAGRARMQAARLVDRGGPAVLVTCLADEEQAAAFYRLFYDNLIHDLPHDVNLTQYSA